MDIFSTFHSIIKNHIFGKFRGYPILGNKGFKTCALFVLMLVKCLLLNTLFSLFCCSLTSNYFSCTLSCCSLFSKYIRHTSVLGLQPQKMSSVLFLLSFSFETNRSYFVCCSERIKYFSPISLDKF